MLSLILRSLVLGATTFGVATLVPKANLDRRTKLILAISVIALCIILDFGAYALGKLKGAICRCEDAAQSALRKKLLAAFRMASRDIHATNEEIGGGLFEVLIFILGDWFTHSNHLRILRKTRRKRDALILHTLTCTQGE
mgnify:CR=1 FL=1